MYSSRVLAKYGKMWYGMVCCGGMEVCRNVDMLVSRYAGRYVNMYACMHVRTYVHMDGWIDGWMDGGRDGWMDVRTHGCIQDYSSIYIYACMYVHMSVILYISEQTKAILKVRARIYTLQSYVADSIPILCVIYKTSPSTKPSQQVTGKMVVVLGRTLLRAAGGESESSDFHCANLHRKWTNVNPRMPK